jgi:hypothetical protein
MLWPHNRIGYVWLIHHLIFHSFRSTKQFVVWHPWSLWRLCFLHPISKWFVVDLIIPGNYFCFWPCSNWLWDLPTLMQDQFSFLGGVDGTQMFKIKSRHFVSLYVDFWVLNFKNFQITTFALCVRSHTNAIKILMVGSMSMDQLVNKISVPACAEKGHGPRIDLFLIEWFYEFFIGKWCDIRRDKSVVCIVKKCIFRLQWNSCLGGQILWVIKGDTL